MTAILYLIPISLVLGGLALLAFFWTLRSRQYDDLEGDPYRILTDDDTPLSAADRQILREEGNRDGAAPARRHRNVSK